MALTIGLLTLANAMLDSMVAVLHWGAATRLRPVGRAFPAAIPRATLVQATIAPGWPRPLSPCGERVVPGATQTAVTGWRDRQLTSKQAS